MAARAWLAAGWLALAGCAAAPESERPLDALVTPVTLRPGAADELPVGEVSVYAITWGILPVGSVEYRVGRVETEAGAVRELVGLTRASAFVGMFMAVGGTMRSLVDWETFLPRTMLWTNAAAEPEVRTVDCRQDEGLAYSVKFTEAWMVRRTARGAIFHDPLSSIFVARVLAVPEQGDVRFLVVEGDDVHLMTIRRDGTEMLEHGGSQVPCTRLVVRTDRIDDAGAFLDEEPWNELFVHVAEVPGRPILAMSGRTRYARVALKLRERRVPPADLPCDPPAGE